MSFRNITKTIIVGIFIIVQISVFFLAMTKNYIAKETPQHYILISRIANILLIVSIVSTITFFTINKHSVTEHQKSLIDLYKVVPFMDKLPFYDWVLGITVNFIFIWSICIILDLLAIKMPIIGFDVIMGIKEKQTVITTFSKICAILADKPKKWIDNKYNSLELENNQEFLEDEKISVEVIENKKEQIKEPEIKQIEEPKTDPQEEKQELFQPKILNLEEIETYFNKMIEMSDKGIAKGVRKTAKFLDMEIGTATRIFEKLKEKQYIKTVGIQTKILKNEFDKDDFKGDFKEEEQSNAN
jgi:hypothetical protein